MRILQPNELAVISHLFPSPGRQSSCLLLGPVPGHASEEATQMEPAHGCW